MTTTTKAAVASGSVAGGALGGAALGGAFNSGSSKQPTTSVTTTQDNTSLKTPTPETSPKQTQSQEPNWKPLSLEITTENTYDDKIGKEYPHLLVGPYGGADNYNQGWWEKQFSKYTTDKTSSASTLSTEFANGKITVGYTPSSDSGTTTSLNKVCDSIYKKAKTDITSTNNNDNNAKLRDNLWKYCSPIETRPKTIKEAPLGVDPKYEGTAFGKTKEEDLLSVKDGVNDILWDLKQKEFYALTEVQDQFFKTLHSEKTKAKNKKELKNKCKEAYLKTPSSSGQQSPTDAIVVKYCSVKSMSSAS